MTGNPRERTSGNKPNGVLEPITKSFDSLTPEELEVLRKEREADHFHDECGVFAISGHDEAANIVYLGLYALQHRGQESCGIVASNGREHTAHRAMGLVADTFGSKALKRLPGRHAIGHVRYSTAGSSSLRNAQPICVNTDAGPVAIAHNGNIVNALAIRSELEGRGSIFSSTSDSEVILHLLARSREATLEERFIDALSRVKGAFSIVLLTDEVLIAARDPSGFRPLSLGRLGNSYVVGSETCAFDLVGAEFERDIEPGEVVVIRRGRIRSLRPFSRGAANHFCVFEYLYFARPDSNLNLTNVYAYRKELGKVLYHGVYPAPILLKSVTPTKLHDTIHQHTMCVWDDRLSRALFGIGMRQYDTDTVVYDYWKAVDELTRTQMESVSDNPKAAAIDFLEQRILPVWLGEDTPYFMQLLD